MFSRDCTLPTYDSTYEDHSPFSCGKLQKKNKKIKSSGPKSVKKKPEAIITCKLLSIS